MSAITKAYRSDPNKFKEAFMPRILKDAIKQAFATNPEKYKDAAKKAYAKNTEKYKIPSNSFMPVILKRAVICTCRYSNGQFIPNSAKWNICRCR